MIGWGLAEVTVRLGATTALDRVSLGVDPGVVAVVVGGDGAGKTTLARTLAGLVAVSAGAVSRPVGRVGYQPAGSGVWPDLTVTENLSFVASAFHIGAAPAARRMAALLEATGLGAARDRLGANLSGGMRRKLGVAMALLAEPEMVVLDEPTTGVDPVSRYELWRLVSQTAAAGAAVVMTTTYLDEAERAGTILALEAGRTLAAGTPEEVRGSLRGAVYAVDRASQANHQWRRGAAWRIWTEGSPPAGARRVDADLGDVLIAASLAGGGEGSR
ncbi:MAG TPA: ABC transporter ATP-binding protein [Acidimicrobiia bacterium]